MTSTGRRAIRTLAIALAVVLGLVAAGGLTLAWLNRGDQIRRRLLVYKPRLEKQLGRPVSFGSVRLHLWPHPGFEIRDISITGGPTEEPLLQVPYLEGDFAFLPLLKSRGTEVIITDVRTQGLVVTVVRLPDGRLSCQDVLDRLQPRMPQTPLRPKQEARLEPVLLSYAEMLGSALRFRDLGTGPGPDRSVAIEQLDLRLWDVGLGRLIALSLDAAVTAPGRNLHLEGTVGPVPGDLDFTDPLDLVQRVKLRISDLQVQSLAAWFLKGSPWLVPQKAVVAADLYFERPSDTQRLRLVGSVGIKGLVLQRAGHLGQPADILLRSDLEATEDAASVLVRELDLSVNDMAIHGTADLRDLWTRPNVPELDLSSRGIELEKVVALLPPGLLPDIVLHGPVSLSAARSVSAAQPLLSLRVDLSAATLLLPQLHKPAGMPAVAEFRGLPKKDGIHVERLGLVLGPLSLWMKGIIKSPHDLELSLDSGWVELDRLLRLSPTVAEAVRRRRSAVRGDAEVSGSVKRHGNTVTASAHLRIRDARARVPGLTLTGATEVRASGRFSPNADSIEADVDLSSAGLLVPRVIDKPASAPMRLRLSAERLGQNITLKEAHLDLPGASVEARGHGDLGRRFLDVRVPRFRADLTRIARFFPALRDRAIPEGELETALRLDGDPNSLRTVRLRIDDLTFVGAGGTLSGSAEVVGLDRPERVAFDFTGAGLDLVELLGWTRGLKKPRGEAVIDELQTLSLDGKMRLDRVRIGKVAIPHVVLAVTLDRGKGEVKTLQGTAFGGTWTGDGSTVDLSQSPPPLVLQAKIDEVDLRQFLALWGPKVEHKADGRVSIEGRLSSSGLSWSHIWPLIHGPAGFTLTGGLVRDVDIRAKVVNRTIGGMMKNHEIAMHRDEVALQAAVGRVQVGGQRIRLVQPLRASNSEMIMHVTGDIGFTGSLHLAGKMEILPEGFAIATKGKIRPGGAVPVALHIEGDGKLPLVTLDRLDDTVSEMLGGLLGEARQPELEPPHPVLHQPGQDRAGTDVTPALAEAIKVQHQGKSGRGMANIKLGASFNLLGMATQFALVLDIGYAVTKNRNGYLLLPLQFQVGNGLTSFMVPLGFQYDFPLLRGFYLYPRLSVGYAALIGFDPSGVLHSGLVLPELGIKYVPGRRVNFGFEPFSLPIFLRPDGARLSYRLMFYGGINL